MKNEIQKFNFNGSQVRALTIDDEPYFVGKDVAEILGYSNTSKAILKHVDDEDKQILKSHFGTLENIPNRGMQIINESGLYSLILSSKLPNAKKFKHWVTSEVLPAINSHGAYLTTEKIEEAILNPDTIIKIAKELKNERERRMIAEQRNHELQPKADYCDMILANKSLVTITYIAKDYGMSGQKMNKLLHKLGIQYRQGETWLLYAKYQDKGWTQSKTTMVPKKDGTEKAVMNTKWTQKGRLGLYELLKKNNILPKIEQNRIK